LSNILFVLFAETGSVKAAVQQSSDLLQKCSDDYESCVAKLFEVYGNDPSIRAGLKKLVTGCRYFCTGTLTWNLSTKRYNVEKKEDGPVIGRM